MNTAYVALVDYSVVVALVNRDDFGEETVRFGDEILELDRLGDIDRHDFIQGSVLIGLEDEHSAVVCDQVILGGVFVDDFDPVEGAFGNAVGIKLGDPEEVSLKNGQMASRSQVDQDSPLRYRQTLS